MTELLERLQGIPKPKLRLMSTPILGVTRPETWAIRAGKHDDELKALAPIIGLSEYVIASDKWSPRRTDPSLQRVLGAIRSPRLKL